MNKKKVKLVKIVSPDTMDGNTKEIKWINSLLTKNFIATENIPSDECLTEAIIINSLCFDYLNKAGITDKKTLLNMVKYIIDFSFNFSIPRSLWRKPSKNEEKFNRKKAGEILDFLASGSSQGYTGKKRKNVQV